MADQIADHRSLSVAVVGSGPAGVYAVQALLRSHDELRVDVFDQLPAPFGLVRYGVAPDHMKIKSISRALRAILESPRVRFLGNVTYGVDIDAADLRRHYDVVIHASGSQQDRHLGIPGEELVGSAPAADFVNWYNGHPYGPAEFPLDTGQVAVVGAGNVALDAARMLVTDPAGVGQTDVPDEVLATYHKSRVTDVHLFARRGPQFTKFTTPELRELADLPDVDLVVAPADVPALSATDDAEYDRTTRNNLAVLRDWAGREPTGASRRIRLWFWRRPVRILGGAVVEALEVEETELSGGRVSGTGRVETVAVQAVLRAVGYGGVALPGLPFDPALGTVPHRAGRVVDTTGQPVPGVYVAGWIKRGPIGVIGTNRSDAAETVRTVLGDLAAGEIPSAPESAESVPALLTERGIRYTTWEGWLSLERYEALRGAQQGRPAAKVAELATMLEVADGGRTDGAPRPTPVVPADDARP